MRVFKVNYLKPNPRHNGDVRKPLLIHDVATYKAESEEEAIAKFHKYHDGKHHQFQFIWEEKPIDKLRRELGRKLLPR